MRVPWAAAAMLLVVALGGCTSTGRPPTASTGAVAPSTGMTALPAEELPADALFRITAIVTASSGESARLVETVFAPTAGDGTEPAQLAAARCSGGDWMAQFPHPHWLAISLTSTLISGDSWPDDDLIDVFSDGTWTYPAWSGSVRPVEANCASPLVELPGKASAVIPIDPSVSADDSHSWGAWRYGFRWGSETNDPSAQPFAFTSCVLERGIGASASQTVTAWNPAAPGVDRAVGPAQCFWGTLN